MKNNLDEKAPAKTSRTGRFEAGDTVRKYRFDYYGKRIELNGKPYGFIRGHVYRATPSGRGLPAQAFVRWDDGSETWERQRDLV
jgi:hypothetical protein